MKVTFSFEKATVDPDVLLVAGRVAVVIELLLVDARVPRFAV